MDGMEGKETTHFALSIRNGVLLNVCKRTGEEGFTYYVKEKTLFCYCYILLECLI